MISKDISIEVVIGRNDEKLRISREIKENLYKGDLVCYGGDTYVVVHRYFYTDGHEMPVCRITLARPSDL